MTKKRNLPASSLLLAILEFPARRRAQQALRALYEQPSNLNAEPAPFAYVLRQGCLAARSEPSVLVVHY